MKDFDKVVEQGCYFKVVYQDIDKVTEEIYREIRRNWIGASDSSKLLNLNPFPNSTREDLVQEKVTGECVYTKGINGVRYIVPQRINHETDTDVKLYFRVGAVFNNAKIIVECDGKEILSKKKVKLCPGEMEYVTLKQAVINELPVNAEITVRVEA